MMDNFKNVFVKNDNSDKDDDGFTLVEVTVVVVILAILSAIAVPSYADHRDATRQSAVEASADNGLSAVQSSFEFGENDYDDVLSEMSNSRINLSFVGDPSDVRNVDDLCVEASWVGDDNKAISGPICDIVSNSEDEENDSTTPIETPSQEAQIASELTVNKYGASIYSFGNKFFSDNQESSDGVNWETIESNSGAKLSINYVDPMGEFALSKGNNDIYRTVDGDSWERVFESSDGIRLTFNNFQRKGETLIGNFALNSNSSNRTLISQDNGMTWNIINPFENEINGRVYHMLNASDSNFYMRVFNNGSSYIYSSSNGINWEISNEYTGTSSNNNTISNIDNNNILTFSTVGNSQQHTVSTPLPADFVWNGSYSIAYDADENVVYAVAMNIETRQYHAFYFDNGSRWIEIPINYSPDVEGDYLIIAAKKGQLTGVAQQIL